LGYNLLTYKPVIYAANVAEDDLADDGGTNEGVQAVRDYAKEELSEVFVVCAQIEQEIAELDEEEKAMFLEDLGLTSDRLRLRAHDPEELAHYSNGTSDIEFYFGDPIGWGELWGIADRTDFDLKAHQDHSKQSLEYFDPETNEKYLPYVIEPSVGVERLILAVMSQALEDEKISDTDTRLVLRLKPCLAPYKAAVLPLSKKLSAQANEIFEGLCREFPVTYDEAQSIGKRYRRQDAIGTPFCVTVDFDTEKDGCVTIRERDSMEQVRVPVTQLASWIGERCRFE